MVFDRRDTEDGRNFAKTLNSVDSVLYVSYEAGKDSRWPILDLYLTPQHNTGSKAA